MQSREGAHPDKQSEMFETTTTTTAKQIIETLAKSEAIWPLSLFSEF